MMASSTNSPELASLYDSSPPTLSRTSTNTEVEPVNNASGDAQPNTGRHRWLQHDSVDEAIVLEPSHPLMKRFQASLKRHLERLNTRLREELLDLDGTANSKQREREDMGNLLYSMHHEVVRQQDRVDECRRTLNSLVEMRDDMDCLVTESKVIHKAEMEKLKAAHKQETETRKDLEKRMAQERQLKAWSEDTEAELTVSQTISMKNRVEKRRRAIKKRQQDMMIYRIMNDLSRYTTDLQAVEAQFAMKEKERIVLCETLIDADADLQALNTEQHRALQAWHSVVLATHKRDVVHTAAFNKLSTLQTEFQALAASVEAFKQSAQKEQERNERLTLVLHRVKSEVEDVERLIEVDNAKEAVLGQQVVEIAALVKQTEKDVSRIRLKLSQRVSKNRLLGLGVKKKTKLMIRLEDSIMYFILDKYTSNKAIRHTTKLVDKARDKTQYQEMILVDMENKLAENLLEMEKLEGSTETNTLYLDQLTEDQEKQEKLIDKLNLALKHRMVLASKRQTNIDALIKKMELTLHRSGGIEATPLELKIMQMERTIQEAQNKSDGLKPYWLRQEGLIVQLSQQRNHQLYIINILRKQVSILDQKNVKTEYDINYLAKEEEVFNRVKASLLARLAIMNKEQAETQGYEDTLDKDNHLMHSQFLLTLKAEELASLQMEAENAQLAEERQQLADKLIAVQRENLAWEKKVQMAAEAKVTLEREMKTEGDTSSMRTEIHRMKVRASQLRRAQDRLVTDLDYCVTRRDAIVGTAEAREAKRAVKVPNTRQHFQKQLEDLANKIKHTEMRSHTQEGDCRVTEEKQMRTLRQLEQKQQEMRLLQEALAPMDMQIEDAFLHKQKNLEQLVRRQKKVRHYGNIKQFSHRPLYKTAAALESETAKQQVMNSDLVSIVEALLGDFPNLRLDICKVLNTLRLQPS